MGATLSTSIMRFLLWLRKSKANKAGTCPVMLRAYLDTHTRAEHATGIRCIPAQWGNQRLRGTDEASEALNRTLRNVVAKATLLADRLQSQHVEGDPPVMPADVVAALAPRPVAPAPKLLVLLATTLAEHYATKPTTQSSIKQALGYFAAWPGAPPLTLATLTSAQGAAFAQWLSTQPLAATTRRSYLGNLSSLLARAAPDHPAVFNGHSRGTVGSTKPRKALSVEWLHKLQAVDLSGLEAVARDLFLLQFYLHGSRVAAVILLQKNHIDWQAGRVYFTAMKSAKGVNVELRGELCALLARYAHTPGPFVLPLLPAAYLTGTVATQHTHLQRARHQMLTALARVGKKIGWNGRLHSHLARHSLALRAFQVSGGLQLPQQLLRHATMGQTSVYIESISPERLDAGAASVYDSLL